MNQPPQDPYYNGPTENANAGQPWQAPGYPQQGSGPNYPPPGQPGYPQQTPNYAPPPPDSGYPPPGSAPNYPPQSYPQETPGYAPPPPPAPGGMPGYPPYTSYPPQPGQFGAQTPQWPNYQQPGMPGGPPKSNSRTLIIVCIALLCIVIVGAIAAALIVTHRSNTTNAGTPTTVVNTSASPTTDTGNPSPTVGTTATPPTTGGGGGGSGTIGQQVPAGQNWVVTVNSVSTSGGDSVVQPKAGDTFLVVDLTLKNVSSTQQLVSSLLDFTLQDSNGGKFNETITSAQPPPPDGNVAAGQSLEGKIFYEVPTTIHQFMFSFAYDFNGGSVSWNVTD